jgi:hypothetical protein
LSVRDSGRVDVVFRGDPSVRLVRRCGVRRAGWRGRAPKKDVNSRWEICPVCRETYLSMMYSRVALELRGRPKPVHNGWWCPKCRLIFGTDRFVQRSGTVGTQAFAVETIL